MSRFSRLEVYSELLRVGLLPLFYEPDAGLAECAIQACQAGGARLVEFTHRGDLAWQTFSQLSAKLAEKRADVILGAGTIDDAPTAALYISSGANFLVGPTFNVEVARLCNRRKIPYIPGCGSVTEIANAEEWGAEICKIFPGQEVGGPKFIQAVLGPRPWSRMMPTGGVSPSRESIREWLHAGACCLGMGSHLINKKRLQAGEFDQISSDVRQALEWIQEARNS